MGVGARGRHQVSGSSLRLAGRPAGRPSTGRLSTMRDGTGRHQAIINQSGTGSAAARAGHTQPLAAPPRGRRPQALQSECKNANRHPKSGESSARPGRNSLIRVVSSSSSSSSGPVLHSIPGRQFERERESEANKAEPRWACPSRRGHLTVDLTGCRSVEESAKANQLVAGPPLTSLASGGGG